MHEYTVYVLGVPDLLHILYDWSLEVMSQVIESGSVLTKEKKEKKRFKEYLSIRWPWEKS